LNPQQTFLELIDEVHLPADWRDKAAAFKYNLLAPLFALPAPRFTAFPFLLLADLAAASLVVAAESLDVRRIFTVDRNDFETYRVRRGHRHHPMEIVS